jgi:D-ribulokinase
MYLSVDVGSASVRSALVSPEETVIAFSPVSITIHKENGELNQVSLRRINQKSSTEIWNAVILSLKQTIIQSKGVEMIYSLTFDATCSLVIIDEINEHKDHDTIMWMDYWARDSAQELSLYLQTHHPDIISWFGETVSPESSLAKICFIKPTKGKFFELPDFLSYKANGVDTRSRNSLACKWGYSNTGWDYTFWKEYLGLDKMSVNAMFGGDIVSEVGDCIGYLLPEIIAEIPEIIDAYSGAIATLGTGGLEIEDTLCVIAGIGASGLMNKEHRAATFILLAMK